MVERRSAQKFVRCLESGSIHFSEIANVLQLWYFQSVTQQVSVVAWVSASGRVRYGRFQLVIWKSLLDIQLYCTYLTSPTCINQFLYSSCLLCALYTDIIINFKSKVKIKNIPYIWFSMGIDHSNPYIHSTTVLCDTAYTYIHACIYMHKDVQLFATV